jgi:hypothetical protein
VKMSWIERLVFFSRGLSPLYILGLGHSGLDTFHSVECSLSRFTEGYLLCHLCVVRHRALFSLISAMKDCGDGCLLRNLEDVGCCWLLVVGCWFHAELRA